MNENFIYFVATYWNIEQCNASAESTIAQAYEVSIISAQTNSIIIYYLLHHQREILSGRTKKVVLCMSTKSWLRFIWKLLM